MVTCFCNCCESVFFNHPWWTSRRYQPFSWKKHKVAVEAAASSSRVPSFFNEIGSNAALALAAKEATFLITLILMGKVLKVLIALPSWSQNCLNLILVRENKV